MRHAVQCIGKGVVGAATVVLFLLLLLAGNPALAGDWIYTVRPGDNLWNLTERYLTRIGYVARLQALNGIEDPYHIPPGTRLRIPVAWMRTQPAQARVVDMRGEVHRLDPGGGPGETLGEGAVLLVGEGLRTGSDSNVTLEFADGSRLLVQQESILQLQTLEAYGDSGMADTRIRLEDGRTEARIRPARGPGNRFELHTPAAVTSVRGTAYRVGTDAESGSAAAEVVEGRVGVSAQGRSRRVRAGFGTVTSAGQAPEPPVKLLPPPDLSALPARFERIPVEFNFPTLDGAVAYRVQVLADEATLSLLFDRVFDRPRLRGMDLPDGRFLMRVRGIDARGLEGLDATHAFTLDARPEPPFLTQPPAGGGVPAERPRFQWSAHPQAQGYHFQLGDDPDFQRLLAEIPVHAGTELLSPVVLAPGTYHWRVATVTATERGPFSDGQDFRRPQPAPQAEAPSISETGIGIRWKAGLPGQRFDFQLASDRQFADPVYETRTEEPAVTVPKPPGGEYFLRMRTIEPDGFVGPWGTPQRITVPAEIPWSFFVIAVLAVLLI